MLLSFIKGTVDASFFMIRPVHGHRSESRRFVIVEVDESESKSLSFISGGDPELTCILNPSGSV